MVDIREQILARLLEVAAGIPGIRSAYRNNNDIPAESLPAVIVFDGDEETLDAPDGRPVPTRMTPEIVVAEKTVGQVGTELTNLRRELIKAVLFDSQLNEQIVKTHPHGNGAIRYLGCQTDVGWMRSMHGALLAQFLFKYSLHPDKL